MQNALMIPQQSEFEALFVHSHINHHPLVLHKNQEIFAQGDPANSAFFVQQGQVKLTTNTTKGKEAVVGIFVKGDFFGEACLHDENIRSATAVALGECRVYQIDRAAMLSNIGDRPLFRSMFVNYLLSRVSRVQEDLIDQLLNPSEKRLARILLILANYGKDSGAPIAPIDFSQDTLAAMIGTTRSRVSFFMNKFRKLGFVTYSDKIHVHPSLQAFVLQDEQNARDDR
ncbi:Crp/Fnr family transcriptional regulator [soil metagenome]